MSSTKDILLGGMATAAAGGKLDSNTIGGGAGASTSSDSSVTTEDEFVTGLESGKDLLLNGEDAPEDQSEAKDGQASPDGKTSTVSTKEVITVTDEQGRKRKIEVDYSNKERIKKAFQLEAGARKWQAERDQARQAVAKERTEKQELASNWQALETAFQKGGIPGLIDLIEGKNGAYKQYEQKIVQRAKFLEEATPEQVEALKAREASEMSQRELARIRKENEDFRKEMSQTKEEADLRSLESRVNPVFDKYRFADKLGDSNDEHMFDEMLWNSALKRLEPYEAQGLEITPELAEREFRAVATALRKRIGLQAEKRASRVVDQKKQEATENVQTSVKNGYKTGGAAKEARDMIDSRNLTGLLKNWGRLGGAFQKK